MLLQLKQPKRYGPDLPIDLCRPTLAFPRPLKKGRKPIGQKSLRSDEL
jgi:hypothetical protein